MMETLRNKPHDISGEATDEKRGKKTLFKNA